MDAYFYFIDREFEFRGAKLFVFGYIVSEWGSLDCFLGSLRERI